MSSLTGGDIAASDGAIGHVDGLLCDDTTWTLRWVVVDTGGLFGGARVLIHPSALAAQDGRAQTLSVRLTKARIEASPGRLWDRLVSQRFEIGLYDDHGWDTAWSGRGFGSLTSHAREID